MPKPDSFSITLETVNSVFGISGDTLRAIAHSYGVDEDKIIIRALTQWAKTEIPDLDLDSPKLTAEQMKSLLQRRQKLDEVSPTSFQQLFESTIIGESNGNAKSESPVDGGNS